jgi:hypothetical protein
MPKPSPEKLDSAFEATVRRMSATPPSQRSPVKKLAKKLAEPGEGPLYPF